MQIDEVERDLREHIDSFDEKKWARQKQLFEAIIKKRNVLGILPTGTGKSLLFTYFAGFHPGDGLIIVIEPLHSIIEDQIAKFKKEYGDGKAGNASVIDNMCNAFYRNETSIIFLSPEQLFEYANKLNELVNIRNQKIQMIVIDEVHTLFGWGTSFRTEFLYIPGFVNLVRKTNKELRVLALTATLNSAEKSLCEKVLGIKKIDNADDCAADTKQIATRFYDSFKTKESLFDQLFQEVLKSIEAHGITFFKEKTSISDFHNYIRDRGVMNRHDLSRKGILTEHHSEYECSVQIRVEENIIGQCYSDLVSIARDDYTSRKTVLAHFFEFKGDLSPEDRESLLDKMKEDGSQGNKVFATKALAMGVDLNLVKHIQMVGIPESWNYYLQERGRIRSSYVDYIDSEGASIPTVSMFYTPDDAKATLRKLIQSEKDPQCIYNPLVNVIERIKVWDYLCLWEWVIDSISAQDEKTPAPKAPKDVDISLEDLLEIRSEDIRARLKNIAEKDSRIKWNSDQLKSFDDIFGSRIKTEGLELAPLIAVNTSTALFSFNDYYPGIFGACQKAGYQGTVYIPDKSLYLKVDKKLNFFDYLVFNAIYTHYMYSLDPVDAKGILRILMGSNWEDTDLLGLVENSIRKIQSTQITYLYVGNNEETCRLFDNGSFPILERMPDLQDGITAIDSSKIRCLFDLIKGRGKNSTAINIIAIYYTLLGLNRHKRIYNALIRKTQDEEDEMEYRRIKIPYYSDSINDSLTELIRYLEDIRGKKQNKSQEYCKLKKKMKKIFVIAYNPSKQYQDNDAYEEEYNRIASLAYGVAESQINRKKEYTENQLLEIEERRKIMEADKRDNLISYISPWSLNHGW